MPAFTTFALGFVVFALALHYVSIATALYRVSRPRRLAPALDRETPVSLLRPVCGVDQHDEATLASCLTLDHPNIDVIFCSATARDPAVALVNALKARFPEADAQLLIGNDKSTANPKLNNLIKGWKAAKHDWIVMADSNVLMPPDYLQQLFEAWHDDTGLVCSPPVGSHPQGFWAEIECAFLNSYQARWQLAADTAGLGFAQGKSMLWRRDMLDHAGGLMALGSEIAEDAAATKVVRKHGLRVRLVDRPFEQPLGFRSGRQVWDRQLRWARLRRATFAAYFVPELFAGFAAPLMALMVAANAAGVDPLSAAAALGVAWYVPEAILTLRAKWHFSTLTPLAWIARDILIPIVWVFAWLGRGFEWRGNVMSTASVQISEQHST